MVIPERRAIITYTATGDADVKEDPNDGGPSDSAVSDPGPAISLDDVLEVLSNRRRRFVLYSLADAAERVADFPTLVEDVATLEAAMDEAALRRDRYLDLAADLYHWHLPVLADVGVVDCDGRNDTIRYRDNPTLETWLARTRGDELSP